MLNALGGVIQELRMSAGMSQQELADSADLHRTYISDIERGARNLTVATLGRIALALDAVPSELFREAEHSAGIGRNARRR